MKSLVLTSPKTLPLRMKWYGISASERVQYLDGTVNCTSLHY